LTGQVDYFTIPPMNNERLTRRDVINRGVRVGSGIAAIVGTGDLVQTIIKGFQIRNEVYANYPDVNRQKINAAVNTISNSVYETIQTDPDANEVPITDEMRDASIVLVRANERAAKVAEADSKSGYNSYPRLGISATAAIGGTAIALFGPGARPTQGEVNQPAFDKTTSE
jgi:uncharacterized protein (DUF433 family)